MHPWIFLYLITYEHIIMTIIFVTFRHLASLLQAG